MKLILFINILFFLMILFDKCFYCISSRVRQIDLHNARTFIISLYDEDYNDKNEMIYSKNIESLVEDEEKMYSEKLRKSIFHKRKLNSIENFLYEKNERLNKKDTYKKLEKEETKKIYPSIINQEQTTMTFNKKFRNKFTRKKYKHAYAKKTQNYNINETTISTEKTSTQINAETRSTNTKLKDDNKINNYEKINPEYNFEIEEIKSDNSTYNFTEEEVEKSWRKIIKKTFDFTKPRNCSEFKGWQLGIKAIKCIISEFQKAENHEEKKKIFAKAWKIIKVWLSIYVCIVILCWCQKGLKYAGVVAVSAVKFVFQEK